MQGGRKRIEDFIRRYWREGNRVLRALMVAVAILLVVLLALRVLRGLRRFAIPLAIGGIMVLSGWLLLGTLTIPRISSTGPVVRNGVAAVMVCGAKRGMVGMDAAMDYVPEPGTGTWAPVRKGACTVWYHSPPDWHQRIARQLRSRAPSIGTPSSPPPAKPDPGMEPIPPSKTRLETEPPQSPAAGPGHGR